MNLEMKIRTAVADNFATRAEELYSANPEMIAEMRKDFATVITKVLDEGVKSGEISIMEAYEEEKTGVEEYRQFTLPENIAQQVSDTWMANKEYYETSYRQMELFALLTREKIPKSVTFLHEHSLAYVGRMDNVVNHLVQKADQEGIETATSVKAIHAAVREEYSTPDDYENSFRQFYDIILQTFKEDGASGFILEMVEVLIDKYIEDYCNTVIKRDIEVLYGET